jgi:hypothetical protein
MENYVAGLLCKRLTNGRHALHASDPQATQGAAQRAHELAKSTGTAIVGRDGVIEYPTPKSQDNLTEK